MPRQMGARTSLAGAFESTYGTAPGSGFLALPFFSNALSQEQPLLENPVITGTRDSADPFRDVITVDGDVVVPVDARAFGVWLRALFGAPASAASVAASGTVTLTANLTPGDTVTVDAVAYAAVASGATGSQFNVGGSATATATALAAVINPSTNVAAAASGAVVTLTAKALGPGGNARTLATNAPARVTLSGTTLVGGANAHTFASGNWALPSLALESAYPQVPAFKMVTGCIADRLQMAFARSGQAQATVSLIGQGETVTAATAAGTPTTYTFDPFSQFQGEMRRGGSVLGGVVAASLAYSNGSDRVEVIRADGRLDGVDPGRATLTGEVTIRFADRALLDLSIAGTPIDLEFRYDAGASRRLVVTAPRVFLPVPRITVPGPAGVQATFAFQAARPSSSPMLTAVLTNDVASY